jgi:CTP synthase
MRLGSYPCLLSEGSNAARAYGALQVWERHRHRYEVNPDMIDEIENSGLVFSAKNDNRMEILELPSHRVFMGTQFHPEFKSRPERPSPPFMGFVQAMLEARRPEPDKIAAKAEKHPLST